VVDRALPFSCTIDAATKFVPFTVSVKPEPPATTELGLTELIVGADEGVGLGLGVGLGVGVGVGEGEG